ncbi:MAG: hypothetical protein AAF587_29290 [Bacteroidota bacterium]
MASNKGRKWLIRLLGGSLTLLLLIQLFISLLLAPLLERQLKQLLHSQTDGLYELRQIDIDWELFQRRVLVSNIQVSLDTTQLDLLAEAVEQGEVFLHINIPQIEMEWLDLIAAFQSRVIHLRSVEIFSPDISLTSHRKKEIEPETILQDSLLAGGWFSRLPSELKGIYVDHLRIGGGTLRLNDGNYFNQNSFVANHIDVTMEEFRLDSMTSPSPDRPFYAKDISVEVGVNDYSYVLADSSYTIQMQRLGVSTSKKSIYAKDVQLQPNFRLYRQRLEAGNRPANLVELHIPTIELVGLDINEIYVDKLLHLDAIRFEAPHLIQIGQVNADSVNEEDLEAANVYRLFSPYLRAIQTDSLIVEQGHFQKIPEPGTISRRLNLEGIGLMLSNVSLDSSLLGPPQRRMFYADELEVSLDRFLMKLSDDHYVLSGQELTMSTRGQTLHTDSIQLLPTPEILSEARSKGQDVIQLAIPQVDIQGLDLLQLWFDRQVEVESFVIQQPDIQLLNYPQVDKEQVDSLAQADLYGLVSDYLESVTVEDFQIVEGNFSLNTQPEPLKHEFSASDIRVHIRNFQLNDSSRQQTNNPFYADDIDVNVNISGYSFELPDSSYSVQAKHIGISAADSAIFADSVWLIPKARISRGGSQSNQHRLKVLVPHIRFSGLDVNQAYFERELDLDSLWLDHPLILLNSEIQERQELVFTELDSIDLYPFIEGKLHALRVGTLQLDSASFSYERIRGDTLPPLNLPAISVNIRNFSLDSITHIGPNNLFYSDDIQLSLDHFSFPLSDAIHQIDVEHLELSTKEKKIHMETIFLHPEQETIILEDLKAPNLYHVRVPEIQIDGVNAYELYKYQRLLVDKVKLSSPHISLTNYPEVNKEQIDSLAQSDLYGLISKQLNELEIGSFVVMDAQFDFNETETSSSNGFSAKDVLVVISDFRLDSTAQERTNNPFYAEKIDMSMDVDNYSFLLPDSTYEIQVDHIALSTADSSVSAQNIHLIPQFTAKTNQDVAHSFEIFAPTLTVSGINPEELYFNRIGHFGGIKILEPRIIATQHYQPQHKKAFDLYQKIIPHLDQLTIKDIQLTHGSFDQQLPSDAKVEPMTFPDFSARLQGFELDSLGWMRADRILYAHNTDLRLYDFHLPIQDSLYSLQAKEIGLSSGREHLFIDSLQLFSNYDSHEYVSLLGYTKDQLNLKVPYLEGLGLNVHELWTASRLDLDQLSLSSLEILVEKNRNYQENPNKRPPLLQDLLRNVPIAFSIDSVKIQGGHLNFYEQPANSDKRGHFFFDNLTASVRGLSNDSLNLNRQKKPQLVLQASANLMGLSKLSTTFTYQLGDSSRRYSYTGVVEKMPLKVLNTILEPSASITVRSGLMDNLRFNGQANDRRSRGRMWMEYRNLNVALIEAPSLLEDSVKKRRVMSAIANTLVVKSRNPRRRFRVGRIRYEIDKSKIFFSHWIQALLSGIKSSVGLENREEKDKTTKGKSERKRADRAK